MGINNELSIKNESMVEDVMADAETEEALAEFDFLVSESGEGAGEARSQGDGTDWGKSRRVGRALGRPVVKATAQTGVSLGEWEGRWGGP